jgi:hypothetical protein
VGLLTTRVALGDIRDAGAFVNKAINRLGLQFGSDERDELEAESLVILYELHAGFLGGSFGTR